MKKNYRDLFWDLFKMVLLASVIAFVVRGFIFIPLTVEGNSMEKNLMQGDYIIVDKVTKIKRFNVVVFQLSNGTTYIKRVIGMPGDRVAYKNDQLYINGEKVEEKFLTCNKFKEDNGAIYTTDFEAADITGTKKIPKNSYFVLGDNRRISKDSRSFGVVKAEEIYGKASMVYYPLNHFARIK